MKPRRTLQSTFTGIFILLLLFFGGCKKQKVWKIAYIGPMSGDYADSGLLESQSVQLAIREFQDKYGQIGGKDIQLIVRDSKAQPQPAAIAAKELIEKERINALIGPSFSSAALAVADDFQSAKIPLVTGSATNPQITRKGNYIFRTIANDNLISDVLAHYFVQKRQTPSLRIFYTLDDAYSETLANSVAGIYKGLGGEVLANTGIPKDETDFRPYLEGLAPAAIFLPLHLIEFSAFITQLRKNIRYQNTLIIGSDTIMTPKLFELAGNMTEGVIIAASPQINSYRAKYFEALYKVSFNMEPDIFSRYYYDGAAIFLNAMRKVYQRQQKMEPNALRQEIQNTIYTGVTGKIEFDANGDTQRYIAINTVRDRKFETQELYILNQDKLERLPIRLLDN